MFDSFDTHFIITIDSILKLLEILFMIIIIVLGGILSFFEVQKKKRIQRKKPNQLKKIQHTVDQKIYLDLNEQIKKVNEKIQFINASNIDVVASEELFLQERIAKTNQMIQEFRNATSDVRDRTVDTLRNSLDSLIEQLHATGLEEKAIQEIEGIAEEIETKKN